MNPSKIAHLSWAKLPIEKSIAQCKQAMVSIAKQQDRIANPPAGAEPVWFVNQNEVLKASSTLLMNNLAQIEGALGMIESSGGFALSKEIRVLANYATQLKETDDQDKCLVALQSALDILPNYIGMIIEGAHDSPGVLLRHVNELRALRGVSPMSDDSALPMNLTFAYTSPPYYESDCDLAERERIFNGAASSFAMLYSEAVRTGEERAWLEMRKLLRDLQRVTNDPELGCYWWAGEAIIDVIVDDGLTLPAVMNTALRVVMVATQRLPDGEQAAKEKLSPRKFSALLNSLSISRKQTETSRAVIAQFDVKENVEVDQVKELQLQLEAHSVQSLSDILDEIKPRLETAMIAFGRGLKSKHPEGFKAQMQAFDQAMRTIANVFGVFNEHELSDVCFELADMAKGCESANDFTDESIETVKKQILFLDTKLSHLDQNPAAEYLQIQDVGGNVIDVIAQVTHQEINKVMRSIAVHIGSGIGSEKLLDALESLQELGKVYEFAGSSTIGSILAAIVTSFTNRVSEGVLEDSPELALSARALVSVELYLQYITSGLKPIPGILEEGIKAVQSMGLNVSTVQMIDRNALLDKFDASIQLEDDADGLMLEITELRSQIEPMVGSYELNDSKRLNAFATACLRLSAASEIKDEKNFAQLCKVASEIAKVAPGRADDPQYNGAEAKNLISQAADMILRSMDDYSTKGSIPRFLVELTERIAKFNGTEQASDADTDTEDQRIENEEKPEEQPMPDGFDPVLIKIFREEFTENLQALTAFLEGDDQTVTPAIARAIHTILGCSSSANCTPIVAVFDVLEAHFFNHRDMEYCLTETQTADLLEMLHEIASFHSSFPWVLESDLLTAWLEIAGTMAPPVSEEGFAVEPIVEPSTSQAVETAAVHEVTGSAIPAPASVEKVIQDSVQAPAKAEPEIEYDLEMYDMYLLDADEVIPQLQENVEAWVENISDKELAISIRRNMHTLKGAAAIIQANGIGKLTHHMESLFEAIAIGSIKADQPCIDLVRFIVEVLITMTDAVRSQEAYSVFPNLVDFVEKCCDVLRVDGQELYSVLRSDNRPITAPHPAPEPEAEETFHTPDADETTHPQDSEGQTAVLVAISQAMSASEGPEEPVVTNGQSTPIDTPGDSLEASQQASHAAENVVSEAEIEQKANVSAVNPVNPESGDSKKRTRRGYRGLRGRAHGEREKNWQKRQAQKEQFKNEEPIAAAPVDATEETPRPLAGDRPEAIQNVRSAEPIEVDLISKQAIALMEKARDTAKDASRNPKKKGTTEKLRVDLMLMDKAVSLANELKASSYRQNAIYRDMMSSIIALREKLSLHLMHHNKMTVQLRHFNNQNPYVFSELNGDKQNEQHLLNLERFNHLSVSNTRAGNQIEELLQDCEETIGYSALMEGAFRHQVDVTSSLQRDLLSSRLVSFRNERDSINAAVKNAIQKTNKKVKADVHNTDTLIDRQLLESLRDPIRHIINNSIAHGIEDPEERIKAGKAAEGKITVSATRQAKSIVIQISDDGRGIDRDAVRRKAISQGLISPDAVLSDEMTFSLITQSGFSTAENVSELAGRGVGMEAASSRIQKLGGKLVITSRIGEGTTMSMEMPLTIGSNRALVCSIGDQWYAIPTFNMLQVIEVPVSDLLTMRAKATAPVVTFDNREFGVVHLADLIAVPDLKTSVTNAEAFTKMVLIEQNELRLAIEVEQSVSMPEIHVTKFDGILNGIKGIIGSTEIHDGTPALVLDVVELAKLNLSMTPSGYTPRIYRIRRVRREVKQTVLVVDDSTSYRRLLSHHLESAGWEVTTAQDGQDAIEKLKNMPVPTLFVVDVEMPRMDGLVLTEKLRANEQTKGIPIIMLTTRSNVKEKALELGVNEFLSKPYKEAMFNEAIAKVCPVTTAQGVKA